MLRASIAACKSEYYSRYCRKHGRRWGSAAIPFCAAGKQCVLAAITEVGHAVGGVCPFALRPGVEVYLDRSLKRFATVFPACGSSNSAIELTIPELERHSGFVDWVDVCKGWQPEQN